MREWSAAISVCVWVTFIEELATSAAEGGEPGEHVVPGDPPLRTYRIVRKPADGLAYAMVIAEKHRLTYPRLRERLAS